MAHGFGQRLDLPIPLWLWLAAAGMTVVTSFALVIDFLPAVLERTNYPRLALSRWRPFRLLTHWAVITCLRSVVLALSFVTLAAALYGNPEPEHNIAPAMVWVVAWVGLTFACALVGNLWAVCNPFATLYDIGAWCIRLAGITATTVARPYPAWLGTWPAVVGLYALAYCEHVTTSAAQPRHIGVAMLIYSVFTLAGMTVFGRAPWLRNAETFSVAFALFGRFAPFDCRRALDGSAASLGADQVASAAVPQAATELYLRAPAVGLLDDQHVSPSLLYFVLLLLSSVTFDGFVETSTWRQLAAGIEHASAWPNEFGAALGQSPEQVIKTVALIGFPLLFVLPYVLSCAAMVSAGIARRERHPFQTCISRFVLTLMPIAIAYHLSHYLTLLYATLHQLPTLLADPFGTGKPLFDLAPVDDMGQVMNVHSSWTVIILLIIAGHVLAVYLAHVVALDLSDKRGVAIRSQLPLLAIMVVYTMVSLWLLAQPIM